MERQPRFDLTAATEAWLDPLRQRGTLTDDDLRELQTHLLDGMDSLKTNGLSEEEAFLVARHRLGSAEAIGEEFGKIQRPFAVRREPVLFLLGALVFVVLKNGLDAAGFGATSWLVANITDDRLVTLADFGVRLLLFVAFVVALAAYFRRGEVVHRRMFAWLHRAPVGMALVLTGLVGLVQFAHFFGEKAVFRLERNLPDRDLYGIRLNERLFVYGIYIAWLVALLLLTVRQGPAGQRSLASWLKQAHAVPLTLLGFGIFLSLFLGVSIEIVGRFLLDSNEWLAPGSALLYCLLAGFALQESQRYGLLARFLIAIGPILLWVGLGIALREDPVETWKYFLLRTGGAALIGAAVGFSLGALRRQKRVRF